jgi:hypothetical protein
MAISKTKKILEETLDVISDKKMIIKHGYSDNSATNFVFK